SNTIEIKALNAFYFEILVSRRSKIVIDALSEVITNRLQNPEVIAHTVEWINEQHLDDDLLKTTPLLTLTPSSVPLPIHVALKRRSYLESPSEENRWCLLAPKHVQYLQPSWLQKSFSLRDLTKSLKQAIKNDNSEAFTVLLRIAELQNVTFIHRAQVHQNTTLLYCSLIQYCVIKNANHCLKLALKANPEQINVPSENCTVLTPLHLAVIFDNPMTVRILLDAKAELNTQTLYGYTPMHWAIYYKRKDIIAQLLECKPKPDLTLQNQEGHDCYLIAENEPEIQRIIYNKIIIASDTSLTDGTNNSDTEHEGDDTNFVLVSFDT
ncbi:MAG: ankyrin repeat domain-containing protein, partial [Shewanella sp.]|nr:ankyrin repeat domain-containing protein [Shewanella sp.]